VPRYNRSTVRIHVPAALMLLVLGLAFCVPAALAQDAPAAKTDSGVMIGVVTDATKQRLPGVMLTIKTAASVRSVVSDVQGRFRIAGLPLGNHRVIAELPGFRRTVKEVELTTRYPEADASFELQFGPLEETLTIPGPAPRYRVWPLGPETR
jgi:hypothetical protein